MAELGIHRSVRVNVVSDGVLRAAPRVGVYMASLAAAADTELHARLAAVLGKGLVVIPVVDSFDDFSRLVPFALTPLNGWEWSGATPARRLARRLLEELGIEDRRRRVFISHKRDDGMAAAGQLYDFLSRSGFEPFIDRLGIGLGLNVQNEIADALEDCAFLLLLETPLAYTSEWVFDEVEYAQSHQMGMHIVTWPGDVPELPATNRWPRHVLQPSDLTPYKGYEVLTDGALDAILADVEAIHANTIVRRRRYLLRNAADAAGAAGLNCTALEGWRLLVESRRGPTVVQVSARLPTVEDLHDLDQARLQGDGTERPGVLVHSARVLRQSRRDMLTWASGARDLSLIPENAIGGYWL
jgi:hypothetical protein